MGNTKTKPVIYNSTEWISSYRLPHGCKKIYDTSVVPSNILEIILDKGFNQKIRKGDLPDSLRRLLSWEDFNQIIDPGTMPANLEYIYLGGAYNKPLQRNSLPPNLKTLDLCGSFNIMLWVICQDLLYN